MPIPRLHDADSVRPSTRAPSWPLVVAATIVMGSALTLGAVRGGAGQPPAPPGASPSLESPTASPVMSPTSVPATTPRPTVSPSPSAEPTAEPTVAPTPVITTSPTPAPTVPPVPPPGQGALPTCSYTDVLTPHHGLDEWSISLLDTIYHLPSGYAPTDLVDSSVAGVNAGYPLRSLLLEDLSAMAADARAAGAPIQVVSGYRSYTQQKATFDHWVAVGGWDRALRTSARPGHSEHQLGTAIDVTSEGGSAPWEYADWATTPAGAWMATNAWRYGFVLSYPAGAYALSCYDYEPWHYRYVGRDLAARVVEADTTLRQVLWELQ